MKELKLLGNMQKEKIDENSHIQRNRKMTQEPPKPSDLIKYPANEAPPVIKAAPKPPLTVGGPVRGLIPQSIEEAARLCAAMAASGMVPESIQGKDLDETKARALMVVLSGMELGVPPMSAMTGFYIVNLKCTIYGDVALGVVQASDKYEWHTETMTGQPGQDDWGYICTFKRKGIDQPFIGRFTWANAKTAGLQGKRGPWTNYPQRQLQMRARSFAMRDGFSDVLKGMSITEEAQDITPKEVVKQDITTQADDFATAAIAHNPAATVDFSTLQEKEKALVAENLAVQQSAPYSVAQTMPVETAASQAALAPENPDFNKIDAELHAATTVEEVEAAFDEGGRNAAALSKMPVPLWNKLRDVWAERKDELVRVK
jgi:hypothetical protein